MSKGMLKQVVFCDFCGKHQHQLDLMIAGPHMHICSECIDVCMGIIIEERIKKRTEVKHG